VHLTEEQGAEHCRNVHVHMHKCAARASLSCTHHENALFWKPTRPVRSSTIDIASWLQTNTDTAVPAPNLSAKMILTTT
jgi:hypothetical protein